MNTVLILKDPLTPIKALENYASPGEIDFLSARDLKLLLNHPNCTDEIKHMVENNISDKRKLLSEIDRNYIANEALKEKALAKNLEKAMKWIDLKKKSEEYILKQIRNLPWVKQFNAFELIDNKIMKKTKENPTEWLNLIEQVAILLQDLSLVKHSYGLSIEERAERLKNDIWILIGDFFDLSKLEKDFLTKISLKDKVNLNKYYKDFLKDFLPL